MDIIASLTSELNVGRGQVEAAVKLIDEGNTIPFIARYRKEATGSLNDEVLRTLDERLRYLRGLEEKKAQVMASIADQGKLTGELKKKIGEARTMVAVDDLYLERCAGWSWRGWPGNGDWSPWQTGSPPRTQEPLWRTRQSPMFQRKRAWIP